jgi:hypothetical protein
MNILGTLHIYMAKRKLSLPLVVDTVVYVIQGEHAGHNQNDRL